MRLLILIYSLFLFSVSIALAQSFYEVSDIHTFKLYFAQSAWDSIMSDNYENRQRNRLFATLYIDDTKVDSVGVRYKGFSSYSYSQNKKPLNIELNYLNNQRYNGVKTLKLSNGYRDPSFLREVLAYEIARKYMPAGRANHANVYINDFFIGVYTSSEPVDDIFLLQHFSEEDGVFIKGDPALAVNMPRFLGKANLLYLGPDSTQYFDSYELKSKTGWDDLIELCEMIGDFDSEIQRFLNIDRVLWLMAFHNLLVSLDSPINTPRNFYLYKDRSGLFNFIPWDLNMAFGTYKNINGQVGSTTKDDLQKLNPLLNIDNDEFPLVGRLLKVPQYQKTYIAHMKTILQENFANGWYMQRGREIQETIAQYVMADKNKFYSYQDFWENLEYTLGDSSLFTMGIADLMEERITFLNAHLLFDVSEPSVNNVSVNGSLTPGSLVTISAEISEADKVFLAIRNTHFDAFQRIEMFDDGSHNDGQPNDGFFAVQLNMPAGEMHYYIYAENSKAAMFSPPRAEYEYYKLSSTANVVINELLASNDSTGNDEAGEFDDWIELYNNSGENVNLKGYYLSDKTDNLSKWQFPDTSIAAGGYLILWADEDVSQGPLHTNFKLSADGEDLFFMDNYQNLLDHIAFGSQESEFSYGRFPDGTGSFRKMQPTLAESNVDSIYNQDHDEFLPNNIILFQNYPNPFNSSTYIRFYLKVNAQVSLTVYDVTGHRIRSLIHKKEMSRGFQQLSWDGFADNNFAVSSGIYFGMLKTKKESASIKILMVK